MFSQARQQSLKDSGVNINISLLALLIEHVQRLTGKPPRAASLVKGESYRPSAAFADFPQQYLTNKQVIPTERFLHRRINQALADVYFYLRETLGVDFGKPKVLAQLVELFKTREYFDCLAGKVAPFPDSDTWCNIAILTTVFAPSEAMVKRLEQQLRCEPIAYQHSLLTTRIVENEQRLKSAQIMLAELRFIQATLGENVCDTAENRTKLVKLSHDARYYYSELGEPLFGLFPKNSEPGLILHEHSFFFGDIQQDSGEGDWAFVFSQLSTLKARLDSYEKFNQFLSRHIASLKSEQDFLDMLKPLPVSLIRVAGFNALKKLLEKLANADDKQTPILTHLKHMERLLAYIAARTNEGRSPWERVSFWGRDVNVHKSKTVKLAAAKSALCVMKFERRYCDLPNVEAFALIDRGSRLAKLWLDAKRDLDLLLENSAVGEFAILP